MTLQPTPRLLWLFTGLGLPAFASLSFSGALPFVGLGLSALLLLVILGDAFRLWIHEPTIGVDSPKKLQGSVNIPFVCEVRIHSSLPLHLLLEPETPLALVLTPRLIEKKILPEEKQIFSWTITANKRGLHRIERWHFASLSPLALWRKKSKQERPLEIWIYPNLLRERSSLAPFLVKRLWEGEQLLRQAGQGREFDRLREYAVGDSLSDIHWKATARHSKLISKTYRVEKNQEVYVILDTSRLSSRPSPSHPVFTHLDHAIDATLWRGRVTEKSGDRFGVMAFSDRIHSFIRSGTGIAHRQRCRDAVFRLEPRRVSPDFEEMTAYLRLQLRKRALLLFITSLDDPLQADLFQERIRLLTGHHLVHVVMPIDRAAEPLFQSFRPLEPDFDPHQKLAGHLLWNRMQELRRQLSLQGARLTLCDESRFSRSLIQRYLEIKRSQAL